MLGEATLGKAPWNVRVVRMFGSRKFTPPVHPGIVQPRPEFVERFPYTGGIAANYLTILLDIELPSEVKRKTKKIAFDITHKQGLPQAMTWLVDYVETEGIEFKAYWPMTRFFEAVDDIMRKPLR